jgi:hypothetical protein
MTADRRAEIAVVQRIAMVPRVLKEASKKASNAVLAFMQ